MFKPDSVKKSCVVVLGMHRSGTSAMAACMNFLGMEAGGSLIAANEFNARGYWENAEIVRLHDALLGEMGRLWSDERCLPDGWLELPSTKKLKTELKNVVANEIASSRRSFIKDPRMCRLLPLWREVFDELGITPLFVLVMRHPQEVAASLAHRDNHPVCKSVSLWLRHVLEAERHTRDRTRVVVAYADLMQDWKAVARRIADGLRLELDMSDGVVDRISGFLDQGLRHHRFELVEEEVSPVASVAPVAPDGPEDWAKRLYSACVGGTNVIDGTLFDDVYTRYDEYLRVISPWLTWAASLKSEMGQLKEQLAKSEKRSEASASEGAATSTLYWRDSSRPAFVEERTVAVPCGFDEDEQEVRFVFPSEIGCITGLRFDIIDCPAAIVLSSMRLIDANGSVEWEWGGEQSVFVDVSADVFFCLDGCPEKPFLVFSSGNDPHFRLNLSDFVLAGIASGWQFVVRMQVNAPAARMPHLLASLATKDEAIRKVSAEVDAQNAQLALLQGELTAIRILLAERGIFPAPQDGELTRIMDRQQQCRDELVRLGTELTVLKQVVSDESSDHLYSCTPAQPAGKE